MKTIGWPADIGLNDFQHNWTLAGEVPFLNWLAEQLPGNILEVGCYRGQTTLALATTNPGKTIFAIDRVSREGLDASQASPTSETICELARGERNVVFVEGDSTKLDWLRLKDISLVFIDGDHSFDGVKADSDKAFEYYTKSKLANACIVWHDYGQPFGVTDFVNCITSPEVYHLRGTMLAMVWLGQDNPLEALVDSPTDRPRPKFSLCHSTARVPAGWEKAAWAWREKCDHPEDVEYILGFDNGAVAPEVYEQWVFPFENSTIAVNTGRKCAVDGWNATGRKAQGQILITVADDWFPCEHWDTELLKAIPDANKEWCVQTDTGGDAEILTFSILTRPYFERLTRDYGYDGGFFYGGTPENPGYFGMYGDYEFTRLADRDRVILDATHLKFPHEHPHYTGQQMDEVHEWQHRPEAFEHGEAVFDRRAAELGLSPSMLTRFSRALIAVCLPTYEGYSACWTANWTALFAYLMANYRVLPLFAGSSNVYAVRAQLAKDVLHIKPMAKYTLWIDSDNLLTVKQFRTLIDDLETHSDIDMVAAWCWDKEPGKVSVGTFGEDGSVNSKPVEWLFEGPEHLKAIEWTGFPVVLMRAELLEKAGQFPFAPFVSDVYRYGLSGEDSAFCKRILDAGAKLVVDRRVRVEHLKLQPEGLNSENQAKEKVA